MSEPRTKRPSFQFYPSDWRSDPALRMCSVAARGLWIDMLAIMHDCEPYGVLMFNGRPMTDQQLARLAGDEQKQVRKLLAELEEAGVFSRREDGAIYSRRMLRDEAVRNARAEGGKAGAEHGAKGASYGKLGGRPRKEKGPNKPPLDADEKPPLKPAPSTSSSTSSSGMNDWLDERGREPEPVVIEPEIIPNDAHALAAECAREAGVPHISPAAINRNVEAADGWLKAGIDPVLVVLPTIRRIVAASAEPISSLRYFDREIRHEHARRKATLTGAGDPRAATAKPVASGAVLGTAAALDRLRGGMGDFPPAHVEH